MKTVLLEGSIFSAQIASGISNYLSNLIHYVKVKEKNCGFQSKTIVLDGYDANVFVRERNINREGLILLTKPMLFFGLLTGRYCSANIFHSPYMFLPPRSKSRINLLTVHDLINFEKDWGIRNELRGRLLRMAISRADHFVCISQTTKDKLKDTFPHLNEERMHVIYQGIDSHFIEGQTASNLGVEIRKPYLLYVGERSGYKNFASLENFLACSSYKTKIEVLCVGGGSFTQQELRRLSQLGLENCVKHVGFVETSQLKFLFENALALVYTSLQEGFGLPIIEAMACGCPVLCGGFSSMKEISSGHSILMEDFSPESFEDAIARACRLSSEDKAAAKVYASRFTWQQTADKTLELYTRLLGS